MANLTRKTCTTLYQNRPRFVKDITKKFWCVFGSQFHLLFTYKTRTLSFTRWCSDTIQVSWKTFKLLYHKFIKDNVYQILSESTRFRGRYDKNILMCFFQFTVYKHCYLTARTALPRFDTIPSVSDGQTDRRTDLP